MNDQDDHDLSEWQRTVLRRLVDVSGDSGRLVTPSQLFVPADTQPTDLVRALDALVRDELAERIVPAMGESSYRPTERGCLRARDLG